MTLDMTPWVDTSFKAVWERISHEVPASWMPQWIKTTIPQRPVILREFACGDYGCVLPTSEPGLVVKLTSDISEAHFVQMSMELETSDAMKSEMGLVEYRKIFKLEGQTYRRRPLFVLWRSEAFDIGLLSDVREGYGGYGYDEHQTKEILRGLKSLQRFLGLEIGRAHV